MKNIRTAREHGWRAPLVASFALLAAALSAVRVRRREFDNRKHCAFRRHAKTQAQAQLHHRKRNRRNRNRTATATATRKRAARAARFIPTPRNRSRQGPTTRVRAKHRGARAHSERH